MVVGTLAMAQTLIILTAGIDLSNGAVMAFGTILAAWPGRRRRPTTPASAPVPATDDEKVPEAVGA